MTQKVGVFCKRCGKGIEVEDDYLPGIRGAQLAADLYRQFLQASPNQFKQEFSSLQLDRGERH
jgi:hypothetical protein